MAQLPDFEYQMEFSDGLASPAMQVVPPHLYSLLSQRAVKREVAAFVEHLEEAFPSDAFNPCDISAIIASVDNPSDCREKARCGTEQREELKKLLLDMLNRRVAAAIRSPLPTTRTAKAAKKRKREMETVYRFEKASKFTLGEGTSERTYMQTFACMTCGRSVRTKDFVDIACACFSR